MKKDKKKVYIRSFGCQMNERDSEWVTGALLDKGYKLVDSAKEADVVIFNTCSVRQHAEHRAISNMGKLKALKKENPRIIFGLMGCTAEYRGKKLFQQLSHLDFICGTGNIHAIPSLISNAAKKKDKQLFVGRLSEYLPEKNPSYRNQSKHASVLISRGCNNYCTYCIVPYVRGPERSRMPESIIKEVKGLLKRGFHDIMLLGQNVNSYGRDLKAGIDFVKLLKMIDAVDGKKSIRFMTSHPKDASVELFEAMGTLKSLSKHLHLPIQSGSDNILKAMNRGYDSKYYLSKAKIFKKIVPNHTLTTDIIVGFPGETIEDHEATKHLLKEIKFNSCYIFKYSARPPASSSKLKDDIPKQEKERRHQEILKIQRSISKKKRKR